MSARRAGRWGVKGEGGGVLVLEDRCRLVLCLGSAFRSVCVINNCHYL